MDPNEAINRFFPKLLSGISISHDRKEVYKKFLGKIFERRLVK